MKSDWYPARVSKKYKKNWEKIRWDSPPPNTAIEEWEATIKGTAGPYKWRKETKDEMEKA